MVAPRKPRNPVVRALTQRQGNGATQRHRDRRRDGERVNPLKELEPPAPAPKR